MPNLTEILLLVSIVGLVVMAFMHIRLFERQRREWNEERSVLLDRIQAGSFIEYKAQERADKPIERKKKDQETMRLEREPWA